MLKAAFKHELQPLYYQARHILAHGVRVMILKAQKSLKETKYIVSVCLSKNLGKYGRAQNKNADERQQLLLENPEPAK